VIRCVQRVKDHVRATRAAIADCGCRPACDELLYDVTYSLSTWPAAGFEGDIAYNDVIKIREFILQFNNSELMQRYFNETGDRLTAMRDFSKITVYVSDPEVQCT